MTRFTDHAEALCRRAPNAKTLVFAGETSHGPVTQDDRPDPDAGGEMRLVRRTVAVIPRAHFPTLAHQDTLTIDGTAFVVRDILLMDDGETQELVCAAVTA